MNTHAIIYKTGYNGTEYTVIESNPNREPPEPWQVESEHASFNEAFDRMLELQTEAE